jgi:heme O synthase-like polyprenyltransferase
MWLLLLEAMLALCVFVFIVMWTMWPKRRELRQDSAGGAPGARDRQAGPPSGKGADQTGNDQ